MPLNSTGWFLIASIRAVRSSRRHLYLASYQEPIRRLSRPLEAPGAPGPSELSGPSGPLKPLVQSVQLGQLGQSGQLK